MKKNTRRMMQGLGVAMTVGGVAAAATSMMGTNKKTYRKNAVKAADTVASFMDNMQSMMK
ncbi:MAG: hypothetical protein LIO46_07650 [Clostridiales bacterium]|nr:hypothetical protein [Clostridiales bacterium]